MDPLHSHPDGVDPLIGKVVEERYRIEELLGQGGIGRVYKARHATLGKLVALKVLLTRYESVPVLKQRFQREAEALAALSHPNIVTVTDYGVADGTMPFIVMEMLEGEDLNDVLARGEVIEPRQGLNMMRQMLRALAYAHEQGLVHRDLKPHNVFVRSLGGGDVHVEVLDFGLARFVTDAYKNAPKLTAQGALLGTPAYMAPEQARGEDAGAPADVYAAGCVLFETLTGRRVFESRDPGEILRSHLLSPPPTLAQADPGLEIDPGLEALVARTLEKTPGARYADAGEMLEALNALGDEPVRRVGPRPSGMVELSGVAPTQAPNLSPKSVPTQAATPSARERDGGPVELPQRRTPLFIAAGCAALLLMGVGAGAVYLVFGPASGSDVPPPPSDDTAPAPVVRPTHPTQPPEPPPQNPFATDVPELLETVYETIESRGGGAVTRRQQNALTRFQAANQADPRPHVLHGHIHVDAGRYELGLSEYQTAVERDARVRGDPLMLPRVFKVARQEATTAAASDFIVEVWGQEAIGDLDSLLAERLEPDERGRLDAIRGRLGPTETETQSPWNQ